MDDKIVIENLDKRMVAYAIERHYDLAYLKLTVIIILLIIIIFYVTCKFNVAKPSKSAASSKAKSIVNVGNAGLPPPAEHYSPAASVLIGDLQ
jgi:hypothetical protein